MNELTLILPYYSQPAMLQRQIEEIAKYPKSIKVIVVDDGSPEPIQANPLFDLYRIDVDIPWNRGEARNIGAYVTSTEWLIQTDIDHVLPAKFAASLCEFHPDPLQWYIFPRWRVGAADETRKKDQVHHAKKFAQIHPHIDSYLMRREMFFTSPYDERYSGCLGGGTPFLSRMTQIHGEPLILSADVAQLHVHTSKAVPDASVIKLSRDRDEYTRRRAQIADSRPERILMHPWHKVGN